MNLESFKTAWRRATKGQDLIWIIRTHGAIGTMRWLRRSLPYYLWLYLTPAGKRERNFDKRFGVETDGVLPRWEMGDVGPNLQHAVQYLPTKPKKFERLIQSLKIPFSQFTFVDIGSGKGRVLLLADRFKFRRLIGVEFVPQLCEIARRNLEKYQCPAEILCIDATSFQFPSEPTVIYMCNPFDGELMERFVESIESSYRQAPRPIFVVYCNAFQAGAFIRNSAFTPILYKPENVAIFSVTTK
ncbi:MAG TPA: class I SAM-dependent methyltransferase [Candidatus Acidoferrales bacterium]|nr:class I SAM-dependent methyltransferase [Candidatus Acidoferrales bacterium]